MHVRTDECFVRGYGRLPRPMRTRCLTGLTSGGGDMLGGQLQGGEDRDRDRDGC